MANLTEICAGLPVSPLPANQGRDPNLPHAPVRTPNLSSSEKKISLQNALKYFPANVHSELAKEFATELLLYGHIYMYRFKPTFHLSALPIHEYPAKTKKAAAIMLMIMNNLDPKVAQYPEELVTYGGNGQVFSNWAQFRLVMHYLSEMEEEQTLVLYSGHPVGLFPGPSSGPRLVITNGMVVPNYSSKADYEKMFALGVTMYGQMTAGSYCYIGPQGIVHGTTLTLMNAGRKYLDVESLAGKVLVTSGLGGMSGAQAKAAAICGCVGVVAEVNYEAIKKRHEQGWVLEIIDDLDALVQRIRAARHKKEATSIAFYGNVVEVWERLVQEWKTSGELLVDLGSDQTSCHDPFGGGYCPVQLDYDKAKEMLASDPTGFKELVQESLRRQVKAINVLSSAGLFFWDYGNAFLLEAKRAGADVGKKDDPTGLQFRYPSYVQDMMGDIFSLGFGPFRWVCTSGEPSDLELTDSMSAMILEKIMAEGPPTAQRQQYEDNLKWIKAAGKHNLVVGSQARILYSDRRGRLRLALAFNKMVGDGRLQGPVVISRDHHDVSGTDSPFRETSNIMDGSAFSADMAVQNCIGDAFRGATWVALHNGGGVGWGEAINGGFGLVLDGSAAAAASVEAMLSWDVNNGVSRRCWSGNNNARLAIEEAMEEESLLRVTLPNLVQNASLLEEALKGN